MAAAGYETWIANSEREPAPCKGVKASSLPPVTATRFGLKMLWA